MESVQLMGAIAAIFSSFVAMAQLLQTRCLIQGRCSKNISVAWLSCYALGGLLWVIYGLLLHSWPLVMSSSISMALAALNASLALYFRSAAEKSVEAAPEIVIAAAPATGDGLALEAC